MTDLYLGLGILALISFLGFGIGQRVARRLQPRAVDLVAVLSVLGVLLYVVALWNDVLLSRLLPFSNLIVLGNWFPPASAFVVGLTWQRRRSWLQCVRKRVLLAGLLGVAWFSAVQPLQGRPPECTDAWSGEVCLQTSRYTCSAACAATLLKAHGIPASEREMAELCLTRSGTNWQGLYRGLKWKTIGTEWDVEVFRGNLSDLRGMPGPAILSVELPESAAETYYAQEWGWIPGQSHSVVFYEFRTDHLVRMAEPTSGFEVWSADELEFLWEGVGIRLVRRPTGESSWATALR